MANWDTTALLSAIRRRARATNSAAPGFSDSTLLDIANEVLISKVAPEMASRRASFFRKTINTTLTVGTGTYNFDTRALGGAVSNFFRVDSTDNSVHPLVEWDEEDLNERDPTKQGTPQSFIIQGDQIRLYPVPSKADILRQVLLRRPNRLVATTAVLTVTSISGAGLNVYNGSAKPSSITTSTPCDFICGSAPWRSRADDQTPSATSGTSVTFTSAISGGVVGDYVCLAGESPVIQLPPEFFAVVAQEAACELLRTGRDRQVYRDAVEALKVLQDTVYGQAVDRVENQPGYLFGADWPA